MAAPYPPALPRRIDREQIQRPCTARTAFGRTHRCILRFVSPDVPEDQRVNRKRQFPAACTEKCAHWNTVAFTGRKTNDSFQRIAGGKKLSRLPPRKQHYLKKQLAFAKGRFPSAHLKPQRRIKCKCTRRKRGTDGNIGSPDTIKRWHRNLHFASSFLRFSFIVSEARPN